MSKYFIFSHHLLNILHLKKEELVKTHLFQNQPLKHLDFKSAKIMRKNNINFKTQMMAVTLALK